MSKKLRHSFVTIGFLVIFNIFAIFFIAEVLCRIIKDQKLFEWTDYRGMTCNLYKNALPVQFHEVLGWIPQPGFSGDHPVWKKK